MTRDNNKKSLRHFQCRDYLWELFEEMSTELECSTDYLINEAMRQYARSRNYGSRVSQRPGQPDGRSWAPSMPPPPPPASLPPAARVAAGMQAPPSPPSPPGPAISGASAAVAAAQQGGFIRPSMPSFGEARASRPSPYGMSAPNFSSNEVTNMIQRPYNAQGALSSFPPPPPPPNAFGGGPDSSRTTNIPPSGAPTFRPPEGHFPSGAEAGFASASYSRPMTPVPPSQGGYAAGQNAPRPSLYVYFQGQKLPVQKDEFVIGRSAKTSDLPIKDGNISRRHAAIVYQNGAYFLRDLGSTNGIEFGGRRIDAKRIDEGDTFHLCDYELRFTYQ